MLQKQRTNSHDWPEWCYETISPCAARTQCHCHVIVRKLTCTKSPLRAVTNCWFLRDKYLCGQISNNFVAFVLFQVDKRKQSSSSNDQISPCACISVQHLASENSGFPCSFQMTSFLGMARGNVSASRFFKGLELRAVAFYLEGWHVILMFRAVNDGCVQNFCGLCLKMTEMFLSASNLRGWTKTASSHFFIRNPQPHRSWVMDTSRGMFLYQNVRTEAGLLPFNRDSIYFLMSVWFYVNVSKKQTLWNQVKWQHFCWFIKEHRRKNESWTVLRGVQQS